MNGVSNRIFVTSNYNRFKTLDGNRGVKPRRVRDIKNSIIKNGYISSPILVNEKMEVIDGQGRLLALRELGLPVEYYVVDGLGVDDCRNINIRRANWTNMDYIKSFADCGDVNYKYINELFKEFDEIPFCAIMESITGNIKANTKELREGRMKCNPKQYGAARKKLAYEREFLPTIKKIKGRMEYICVAVGFCQGRKDINKGRLQRVLAENFDSFGSFNGIVTCLQRLSALYNYRLRGEKVYLDTDYLREREKNGNPL